MRYYNVYTLKDNKDNTIAYGKLKDCMRAEYPRYTYELIFTDKLFVKTNDKATNVYFETLKALNKQFIKGDKTMKKYTFTNTLSYIYDGTKAHTGAHYSLDGLKWFNHGDLCELIAKNYFGYEPTKDIGAWNETSDIADMELSVKSSKSSLASNLIGTYDEIITKYFSEVHSKQWAWVERYEDEQVAIWIMNATEWAEFTKQFGKVGTDKHLHYACQSSKTALWLNLRS